MFAQAADWIDRMINAGHFIHRDEPTVTLAAFKRVVDFSAERAASAAKK